MNLRPRAAAALMALVVGLGVFLTPGAGSADPIGDKKAQAAALQEQLDELHHRASELYEQVNNAEIRVAETEAGIAAAEAQLETTKAEYERVRGYVRVRAARMYKQAGRVDTFNALDATNATEFGARAQYADAAAERDGNALDELRNVEDQLDARRAELGAAREAAEAERATKQSYLDEARAQEARAERLYEAANAELQALIREEEQRRREAALAEAARQRAAQQANAGAGGGGGSTRAPRDTGRAPDNPPPPPSGGAAAAVAYASAQVGKPYCYAGVGPECYDCSGLTMMAWAQAGVSMPHGATAQGQMFPRVSEAEAMPGDLVIFRGGGHVGIYVGGGTMIHAPQTGDVVKYSPAFRGDMTHIVRPG